LRDEFSVLWHGSIIILPDLRLWGELLRPLSYPSRLLRVRFLLLKHNPPVLEKNEDWSGHQSRIL